MLFEMPNCGDCRTCEIACCYHHTGEFSYSPSSFRVKEKPDGTGYLIFVSEKNEGTEVACDGCEGVNVPLCVEVCEEGDVLKGFLSEFMEHRRFIEKVF